jgi:hypothetical protein
MVYGAKGVEGRQRPLSGMILCLPTGSALSSGASEPMEQALSALCRIAAREKQRQGYVFGPVEDAMGAQRAISDIAALGAVAGNVISS